MNQTFEITGTSRKILEQILVSHTLEQLNKIPEGFKNNLIWNIGHIVVVQQMLVYKLSGLPMMVSDELVEKYKKGSQPEQMATQADVAELQSLLFETINQTRTDFNQNLFVNYQEFTTMSGFTLKNAQDAMAFNYYHEAVHTGIMMGIRKFL
jgi:hypothetical protein